MKKRATKKSVKTTKLKISKSHTKSHIKSKTHKIATEIKSKAKKQAHKKTIKKTAKKDISSLNIPEPPAQKYDADNETMKYLRLAFDLEKRSLHFYMTARNKTSDFNMKTFLNSLLDLEITHLNSVGRVHRLYTLKKTAEVKREAMKFQVHKPENPFKGLKQWHRLGKQEQGIYEIFNTALQMEEKAYDFYLDAAKHSKGEFIKEYLQKLAKDEWYHKEAIMSQRDMIYNSGYWLGIDHVRLES
jgi:rubrerythrin